MLAQERLRLANEEMATAVMAIETKYKVAILIKEAIMRDMIHILADIEVEESLTDS